MNSDLSIIANDLMSVGGIERVVSIDDLHRVGAELDEVLGEVSVMEEPAIESKLSPILNLGTGDREVVISAIRSRWNDLDMASKKILQDAVVSETRDTSQGEKLGNDISAASKLPVLFGQRLISLSYRQWLLRKDELITNDMPPTLLLVDLDFSGEGIPGQAGLDLIAQLLGSDPEARIFCGLLTNAYPLKEVHERWRALCDEHDLASNRFVLIPKEALYEDETRFLALVKLVILNGHANELTTIVKESFSKSVETAIERLGKIDPYEFEQIVCVSSLSEGVWEPDTLARIFAVYHRVAVRQAIHAHVKVYEVANNLRKLSRVSTGGWGEDTPRAVELRRLEWFEEAADLNEQLSPIELGDIFVVKSRPEKRYILVSQPCDLMVRKDGRHREILKDPSALPPSSPRDAVARYFGIPALDQLPKLDDNLAQTKETRAKARDLARQLRVRLVFDKSSKEFTVAIEDDGIGQAPASIHRTLLSLGSTTKADKWYLIGVFGQGGSSAYAVSNYSWVLSRRSPDLLQGEDDGVGWTVIRHIFPKNRRDDYFAYLAASPEGRVPTISGSDADFANIGHGTRFVHIGYDFGRGGSAITRQLYTAINHVLYNPVLPFELYVGNTLAPIYGNGYRLSSLGRTITTERPALDKLFPAQPVI